MFRTVSCTTRRRRRGWRGYTMADDDEIQLVNRTAESNFEEDAGLFGSEFEDDDRPPMMMINHDDRDVREDSEPRVVDERHIKHPGKLKMRLRKLRSSRSKRWCWWMTLFFLTILTIIFIAYPLGRWSDKRKEACFDYESDDESSEPYPFLFLPDRGEFHLCERGQSQLKGDLGKSHTYIKEERVNIYTYSEDTVLNITRQTDNCLRMEWTGISSAENPLIDCFVMKEDNLYNLEWYGAHELYNQTWPLNDINMKITPFLPQDYLANNFITYQSRDTFGPVLHPLWLASNGVGILVDQVTPLSVSIKQSEGQLCLQAIPYALECIPNSFEKTKLHYTICIHSTVGEMARYFLNKSVPHPRDVPSKEIFKNPIWSTKNVFNADTDSSMIKYYLGNITDYELGISQLELHDGYGGQDGHYGNLSMDIDTHSLAEEFGIPLTAWVHPFVSPTAEAFMENVGDDFFLPGKSKIEGDSVSLVKWWHEYGAVVNFLDERVRGKHRKALDEFKNEYELMSFSFDAGEVTYLPKCVYTRGVEDPGEFATVYSEFAGNFSGVSSRANVQVGYFSQAEPICVGMLDRSSEWSVKNGLKSVITSALTFGIAGYPFVLGDVIGGSGKMPYEFNLEETPDSELYIRWMQLSTFLPVMQFSVPPYHYTEDILDGVSVVEHAKTLIELHQSLSDVMYDLALNAVETGYPIIRPIWWIDESYDALFIDDQFLIGNDIMIAPVVDKTTSRCVYFPPYTRWHRNGTHGNNDFVTYPTDCSDDGCSNSCLFQVPLSEFLFFTKL